ncbi:MAG: type II toxin-antitoxin system MqsR family toxin [Bacillota bacterium]
MEPTPDRRAVAEFLQSFKELLSRGRWRFADRRKNLDAMARLRLRPGDVISVLSGLRVEDYCEGPLPDKNLAGESVWVFGPQVPADERKVTLYIKLQITLGDQASCISFHEPGWPLDHPLRSPDR